MALAVRAPRAGGTARAAAITTPMAREKLLVVMGTKGVETGTGTGRGMGTGTDMAMGTDMGMGTGTATGRPRRCHSICAR